LEKAVKFFEKAPPPPHTQEFHDLPLVWEPGSSVPDWLSGTYVRNGPAQISFGSERLDWNHYIQFKNLIFSQKISNKKLFDVHKEYLDFENHSFYCTILFSNMLQDKKLYCSSQEI
jgi:hypothetical protein